MIGYQLSKGQWVIIAKTEELIDFLPVEKAALKGTLKVKIQRRIAGKIAEKERQLVNKKGREAVGSMLVSHFPLNTYFYDCSIDKKAKNKSIWVESKLNFFAGLFCNKGTNKWVLIACWFCNVFRTNWCIRHHLG